MIKTTFLSLVLFYAVVSIDSDAWAVTTPCGSLADADILNTRIVLAETVRAGNFAAPDGQVYAVPDFCRLRAVAKPSLDSDIYLEVWLPQDNWNGRYYQYGNAGFSGQIPYASLAAALQTGNVAAATDTGHDDVSSVSTDWAFKHPEKIIDWGYRSVAITASVATTVINNLYDRKANYRYFNGCSTGGRQALVAAQRFPQYFDGILVGAPSSYQQFIAFAWNQRALLADLQSHIPPEKLPAIERAALNACTSRAHVVDGIAADPRHCRFDPAILQCEETDNAQCLTEKQARALRRLYTGPRLPSGQQLYPGFEPTMETAVHDYGYWVDGRRSWLMPDDPATAIQFYYARAFLSHMVYDNPDWDFNHFDLEDAYRQVQTKKIAGQTLASVFNATVPDLSTFRQRGGKLIMYMGWGDSAVAPQSAISYYQAVNGNDDSNNVGQTTAVDFSRLYMVPGMLHCAGGPGAASFGQYSTTPGLHDDPRHNITRALEAWVEQGIAPERLVAVKYVNDTVKDGVALSRPLCPYPTVPVYDGSGSLGDAANFSCTAN